MADQMRESKINCTHVGFLKKICFYMYLRLQKERGLELNHFETGRERSPKKINKQTGQIQETATQKLYAPVNTSNIFRKKM